MDQSNPQTKFGQPHQHHTSPTPESGGSDDEILRLRARVAELQRERDHLVAIVDILQEVSTSTDFKQILHVVSRTLGDAFGLERCTVYLKGGANQVRLVATYSDPSVRNLIVDGLHAGPPGRLAYPRRRVRTRALHDLPQGRREPGQTGRDI